jgi:uncharacterized membrane protein YfcA
MELTIATILVTFAGVFLICFMKGAFGGGFSIVGIPLLSIVMDPVTAGGLLAPLFIAMDLFALLYWTFDVVEAGPSAAVTGARDRHRIRVSAIPLPGPPRHRDRDGRDHPDLCRAMARCRRGGDDPSAFDAEGEIDGLASGVTTMVAHSGGPPLAMYLLPLGLSKDVYAGTTSLFFTVGNATKAVPWLLLVKPTGDVWTLMALCVLAIPAGVWAGWRLHGSLDQRQIYRVCYGLGRDSAEIIVGRSFRYLV